ncbi:serine carboxypeptidase 1-like [Hordeum vulgare subsp. vulgare]|uniref:serine carboxypeptidase 1-like n=1 Tax=Hordeum vulgare subsp. vulgare TaxID=112509 RepID=UPI001D1A402D|nr:serine carboxypeptidase 1-like [Hordeum vulgare subsp. vulgare]
MRNHAMYCAAVLVLAILLGGGSVANAVTEKDVLRAFLKSRAQTRVNGPSEPDTWADPISSFRHLPTKCDTPPAGTREADRIAALPGQPPRVNFDQYSGYVTVSEEYGRALFYYFVEAPYEASSKPLVLWLNGGPGCSSLGLGAMAELGPFRVNPDGKTLSRNRHAWNNVANVIFLESPAGVGFSYSNTTVTSGDTRTAVDAYMFLLNWLERFPEYKGRDFYIAGESYSGHYVPQLATVIVALSELGLTDMNLKGIFVGNPLLDWSNNRQGSLEFLWNHGVISDEVWGNISQHCSFGRFGDKGCVEAQHSFNEGAIDSYNIYAPVCIQSPDGSLHSSGYLPGYDPCIGSYIDAYLNNPEVQKAMHARPNTEWSECAGDMDDACPITATRYSVKDLNLTVTKPWRPWYTPDNEVGGYAQQYEGGFTFASVRGAGHMVPSFQPKRSLVLFYSFMKGVLPPGALPPGFSVWSWV